MTEGQQVCGDKEETRSQVSKQSLSLRGPHYLVRGTQEPAATIANMGLSHWRGKDPAEEIYDKMCILRHSLCICFSQ